MKLLRIEDGTRFATEVKRGFELEGSAFDGNGGLGSSADAPDGTAGATPVAPPCPAL